MENPLSTTDRIADAVATALRTELGVQDITPDTSFSDLGGDSLRALRVLSRLWRQLGVELPANSLMAGTTVAEFVDVVRGRA